ncbi:MAG: TfuA-like protein [Myxococcaceae bacterium]|nr:TfuA-like protein [Myxococcaceae bacterium]
MSDVVVFLGPTLPLAEAKRLVRATFLPPARQGDVFRALSSRPGVIVLIDGVFEAVPSVWHHELRAALASGVHLVGASSMGALRAAELYSEGMLPVGRIAGDYVAGRRSDDADVVLLHGDAESGYRPLTVPLVNVEASVAAAKARRVVSAGEARTLLAEARSTFFKRRTWRALVGRLPAPRRAGLLAWLKANAVDQKALDARQALRVAARLSKRKPRPVRAIPLSSFVRRTRLEDAHGNTLAWLKTLPDADALAKQGLRRLLLASFARAAGLTVPRAALEVRVHGAVDEAVADAEVEALEALVLSAPERFVGDGPSWEEGLVLEARLSGRWPRR